MSYEHAMLLYARLAAVSVERRQPQGQVRFLVLTGIAATRAGWPDVAARCHELAATLAPQHLITRYDSFAAALSDDDFITFARQAERFCTLERAEHLLSELGSPTTTPDVGKTAGETALTLIDTDDVSPHI